MAVETDETVSKDIPADVEQIESVNENELLAQNEEQYGWDFLYDIDKLRLYFHCFIPP